MARFFINRPIVAMVISILMVIVGVVAMVQLPVALYPNIAPPEILLTARYPGADPERGYSRCDARNQRACATAISRRRPACRRRESSR